MSDNFKKILNTFNQTDKVIAIFFFLIVQNKFWCIKSKNLQYYPSVIYLKTEQETFHYLSPDFNQFFFGEQAQSETYPYELVRWKYTAIKQVSSFSVRSFCILFLVTDCTACQWLLQLLSSYFTNGERDQAWQGMLFL